MPGRILLASASFAVLAAAAGSTLAAERPLPELLVPGHAPAEAFNSGMQIVSSDLTARFVSIPMNKSFVIEFARDIKDVLVGSPIIANAVIRTNRRAYVTAILEGQTDIHFFDAQGRQVGAIDLSVTRAGVSVLDTAPSVMVSVVRGGGKDGPTVTINLRCTPDNCIPAPIYLPPQDGDVNVTVNKK
jgi:Flp pilus assembly secretin CpaC